METLLNENGNVTNTEFTFLFLVYVGDFIFSFILFFVFHCIYHPVMVKGVGYFEGGASLGLIQYLKSIHYRLVIALFRLIQVCYFQLRNHLFNTYARSSEKLVFPTPWYAHRNFAYAINEWFITLFFCLLIFYQLVMVIVLFESRIISSWNLANY